MADPKIGWIYVISCEMYKKENIVKIGYTEKPDLIEEEVKISLLQRYGTTLIDPYIISLTNKFPVIFHLKYIRCFYIFLQ